MHATSEMLDFVKAAADVDRLRIIGLLTQRKASRAEIVETLRIPLREAVNHLAFLEHVGVVMQNDGLYELYTDNLAVLARDRFAAKRETYVPAPGMDPASQKVLRSHLNADGSIRQIPAQPAKLRVILDYLIQAFEPDVNYTEREVNEILRRFHADTAALRRYLVDAALLARESDCSRYWRVAPA